MNMRADAVFLFQGDSITDCGRAASLDGLGQGYVSMIPALLAAKERNIRYRFVNRGVGGDRTVELLSRWKSDCLDLKADLLSIMIGVNDVWRLTGEWNGQTFVPFEDYCVNYRKLIEQARGAGIARFALLSPSAISDNQDEVLARHLDQRAAFVRELAAEIGAVYVPIREAQKKAFDAYPAVKWTMDGCHPTPAGHALFARTWLDAVGLEG